MSRLPRVRVRKNSAGSNLTRSRLNLIEGSNVTLTVADDAANDEVDVTIASTGGGGGGAAKAPDTVSGLQAWINGGSVPGSPADGASVSAWDDLTANNNDWSQGVAGEQPTFQTNEINGLSVVRFDASNDGMIGTLAISSGGLTIICVYKDNATTNGQRRMLNGSNNWLLGPYASRYQAHNGQFAAGPAVDNRYHIHTLMQHTLGLNLWVDGSFAGAAVGSTYPGTVGLGAEGAFGEVADCDLAELAIYNVLISDSDRRSVEQWLREKYAL